MTEFERRLGQLGGELEYPPTPPIAAAVTQRLGVDDAAGRRRGGRAWPLTARAALLCAALFLLLVGGVVAAVPSARHAVLDLVGLRGATIERVPSLPGGVGAWPGVGATRASTVESARRSLSFRPLLPARLGEPDGVFLAADEVRPPGGELLLTYAPRAGLPRSRYTGVGLLLSEINGNFAPGFFGKMVPRGVPIVRLRVAGNYAIWVEGLHQFFYKDAEIHTFRIGRTRLAGNTLLVQRGAVMVRIEGKVGLERAKAIAASLRPAPD